MRCALLWLTFAGLAAASIAGAQPASRVARLGILSVGAAPSPEEVARVPLWAPLKDLGWTLGQNLAFEPRFAGGDSDKLPALAAELVLSGPLLVRLRDITEFAVRNRVPTMFPRRTPVENGGFMSYGSEREALVKRAAWYVDKVLRGVKPADLPVEQPSTLELVVNLKTAKAIGVTVPAAFLQRADHVIE